MPYAVIDNFAGGLETRKSALTAPPGTLLRLKNALITPGGEIQKRKAFLPVADLTGTFGLAATADAVYAFTRDVDVVSPTLEVPGVSLVYQKLPNSSPTLQQTDYDVFNGKIYFAGYDVAGASTPLKNPHYYNAVLTTGSGLGAAVKTHRTKVYCVGGAQLSFSAIDDPLDWTTGTGAGYINLGNFDSESENLIALEVYYDKLAITSSEATQIWAVDPDAAQNAMHQLLRGTGCEARLSMLQYGSGDILYLAASGVRSMKARDASNSAAVTDIGSPVDNYLRDLRQAKSEAYVNTAIALLEPVVGRFWMIFPQEILVLSYFPGPKITAWSVLETPAFTTEQAVVAGGRMFLRSADTLYAYGGTYGYDFDNCGVEVRMPYLDMKKPGHMKTFEAIDATLSGTWRVAVSYDFNNPNVEENLATLSASTWNTGRVEMQGVASHYSLRMYNEDGHDASLANLAVHYRMADDEA